MKMTETVAAPTQNEILTRFPGQVEADTRPGYQGYLVPAKFLLQFAKAIRDELGYDYLSSVTAVDYLPDDKLEVVYHVYKTTGGPGLNFKVQVPRDQAVVPSLVALYPGAEFQEREAWDLMGIRFEGHPDLRRILTWEGFEGHPLRKDWHEPYFEEEVKPFKARWPDGKVYRAEDVNPYHDNVQYPKGFDPENWTPLGETALYGGMQKLAAWRRHGFENRPDDHQPGAAASFHPRRVPHGGHAGRRNHRRPETGDGLSAPQPRENRRAQYLLAEHAVYRPAGLHFFDEQQFWLRPGG